ncbi:MAG: M23 family metallopeptidase [Ferruginibacter sp.]
MAVGVSVDIVANFGELRPNHYHMGLDCRTDQKENVPVYAAAEGYVAKVKIEPFGFGRCIYINHPNGLTTLYAHLNAFEPALEKYVTQQQYNLQKWNIFIDIPPALFPVNKGDRIAASGNTGGSQGPHLHFEIRNTESDKNLNPLMFGLPLQDDVPPAVLRLAVYDRRVSTYEQTPKLYLLKKINGVYTVAGGKIIAPSEKLSFAITATDRISGSSNPNGIYGAAVFIDDVFSSSFELDNIGYDDTRYMNAHIDYRVRSSGGSWLQHLSPLPGHNNTVYKTGANSGVVSVKDKEADVKITVADANGNQSELRFVLAPPVNNTPVRNIYADQQKMLPGHLNIFENNTCRFFLPENALYDTVNFIYRELFADEGKKIYQLHNTGVPVHTYFPVSIREVFSLFDTGKVVMKRFSGSKEDFKKANYLDSWYTASFREFGNFQLMVDNIPPSIIPVGFSSGMNASKLNRIQFRVSDNAEDLQSFTALLDGKWLRFTNDKARNFIYNFDEHCPPGAHILEVTATDLVGNQTTKTFSFTR